MTSLSTRLRRGEGPVWGPLKRLARTALTVHLPGQGPLRTIFGAIYQGHVLARETGIWAVRFFYNEPLFRSQCDRVGPGLQIERLPYLVGRGRLELGDRVRLSGRSSFLFGNRAVDRPRIALGDGTFVGHACSIQAMSSVVVGRHCLIAGEVVITDSDGHPIDPTRRRLGDPTPSSQIQDVTIGDDVWIGRRALILKGVTIGDRSVIGAGSVVVKNVPPDSLVAGNPARVVRALNPEASKGDFHVA